MIQVEVGIPNGTNGHAVLAEFVCSAVPDRGELVSVDDECYLVVSRRWKMRRNAATRYDVWCYVMVQPLPKPVPDAGRDGTLLKKGRSA